jgi:hypothetical protein
MHYINNHNYFELLHIINTTNFYYHTQKLKIKLQITYLNTYYLITHTDSLLTVLSKTQVSHKIVHTCIFLSRAHLK